MEGDASASSVCSVLTNTTTKHNTPQIQQKQKVVVEGDPGDYFYIILEGEAVVYQSGPAGPSKVNHLFRSDFFGERALLENAPRCVIPAV